MQQGLTNTELEAALRLVTHFPRGMDADCLQKINSARAEVLEATIRKMVESLAGSAQGGTVSTDQAPTTKEVRKLLELVDTIPVPAVIEFRAADKFKPGKTVDGVRISKSMGGNFKKFFLPKVERNVPAENILLHRPFKPVSDEDIFASIDQGKIVIALAHLLEVLKKLSEKNSWVKTFIVGIDGKIKAVCAIWFGDGWYMDEASDECGAVTLICSR